VQDSLFHKYGGIGGVSTLVENTYQDIQADKTLSPLFVGVDLGRLIDHQVKFFAHALGGPANYGGRSLEIAHAGLGISGEHFARLEQILRENLEDLEWEPQDIETVLSVIASTREGIVTDG